MEAVPRLPMISFDLKISPESSSFGPKLKQYIAEAYHEDPESYSNEIRSLEGLRASAIRPVIDVTGCQTLKKYFCQLLFLESRFPMGKGEAAAVTFSWRDIYASMVCSLADVRFELVSILYNIGALHSHLGAADQRTTSDGMKMACTHFQCAAWAFQHLRNQFPQPSGVDLAPEVMLFMQEVCLAQAQECILEKSMLDNRKATIIAKLAVKVVDYYNQALHTLQAGGDDGTIAEIVGSRICKDWMKYIRFKVSYHTCISLLYQGQQAEEQQKMGERVAFYHAASQELENARKLSKGLDQATVIGDALAFTMDVVEGKRKAATNENEFIYHEEVPERDLLTQVQGVSLVRGIAFSFNDPEVSGVDIFSRLIPMQAHEASSIYSEEKAQLLRTVTANIEEKDVQLASFLTSMQLDYVTQAAQVIVDGVPMTDLPQELVDRAAALSVRPEATKDLVQVMASLANIYHDVESMLEEIKIYLKEEENREKQYQSAVGQRPPSMVATELKREAGKYSEAHAKASESNQTLHRAMTLHVSNLKLLSLPLDELRQHIPTLRASDPNINVEGVKEMYVLVNKIEEMKNQRASLVARLRESVAKDDVTEKIVTKLPEDSLETLFSKEMQKHQQCVNLIDQNLFAQDNILQAMTDSYARHSDTRKIIYDLFKQRETTVHALASSYDAYDDLLAKANKGIEFYRKLETNVSKLLQRVKSTCKVQDEERETILAKNKPTPVSQVLGVSTDGSVPGSESVGGPKLKDYLASMKRDANAIAAVANTYYSPTYGASASPQPHMVGGYDQIHVGGGGSAGVEIPPVVVPSIRPAPVGSEGTSEICSGGLPKIDGKNNYQQRYSNYIPNASYAGYATAQTPSVATNTQAVHQNMYPTNTTTTTTTSLYDYSSYNYYNQPYYSTGTNPNQNVPQQPADSSNVSNTEKSLHERMAALMTKPKDKSSASTSQPYTGNVYPNYQQQNIATDPNAYYGYSMYANQQSYPYQTGYSNVALNSQYSQYPTTQSSTPTTQYAAPQSSMQPQPAATPTSTATIPNQYIPSAQHQYAVYPPGSSGTGNVIPPSTTSTHPINLAQSQSTNIQYSAAANAVSAGAYYPTPSSSSSASSTVPQYISTAIAPQYTSTVLTTSFATIGTPTPSTQYAYQHPSQYGTTQYPTSTTNTQYAPPSHTQSHYTSTVTTTITTYAYSPATNVYPSNYPQSNPNQPVYPADYYQPYNNPQIPSQSHVASYSGHPGYGYDATTGQYQYTSGVQHSTGPYLTYPTATSSATVTATVTDVNNPQETTSISMTHYTSAGNYVTKQTESEQYDNAQVNHLQNGTYDQASGYYYHTPYGYAGQDVLPNNYHLNANSNPHPSSGQPQSPMTYIHSTNTGMNSIMSGDHAGISSPHVTRKIDQQKSNIDLLADIDFNIPHAPLIPQNESFKDPPPQRNEQQEKKLPKLEKFEKNPHPPKMDTIHTNFAAIPKIPKPSKVMRKEKDPLDDPELLNQFTIEVEKFEKFVEGLVSKTLNGPTPLELKWKELQDLQDKEAQNLMISVARCYPMKNRLPDVLPYDHTRVEMPTTKDDYINASHVKNVVPFMPPMILTQTPLPCTFFDFWTMIWEQQCEVILCLLNDSEIQDKYWPDEKGQDVEVGTMKISLVSFNKKPYWVERTISVCMRESRTTRVFIHLQFTSWPGSSFPASPGPLLACVCEMISLYQHQRSHEHPVVVHCESGVGRSGLVCLLAAYITQPAPLPEILKLVANVSRQRKQSLRDREHLKFAYQAILYHAQDLLMKRGILTSRSSFEESIKPKTHTRHPSQDLLHGVRELQTNIERPASQQSSEYSTVGRRDSNLSQISIFSGRSSPIDSKSKPNIKKSDSNLANNAETASSDPLSALDPLWSLKK